MKAALPSEDGSDAFAHLSGSFLKDVRSAAAAARITPEKATPVMSVIRTAAALLAAFSLSLHTALAMDFTDIEGRSIHLDQVPQRIVVGNYIANYLMVGGSDSLSRVVGMTKDGWEKTRFGEHKVFTESFPQINDIPSVGGFHDDILNTETIISLRPEVLLIGRTQYAENNARIPLLEKAGIRVVVLDYHRMTVENHTKSTAILGQLLGREKVAEEQNTAYRAHLRHVYDTVNALPADRFGQKVYLETASKGIDQYGNSYNKTVLWGAILHSLHAANLAENSPNPWGALDREYVIASNPDVIFLAGSLWQSTKSKDSLRMGFTVTPQSAQDSLSKLLTRPGWNMLSAVKNNRVWAVDHGSLRNMADYTFVEYIAKQLYPDAFQDLDPRKNLEDYYRRYLPELKFTAVFMMRNGEK